MNWCISMAGGTLVTDIAQKNQTIADGFDYIHFDYYNCQRLYEDESKFGLISIFLMVVLYVGLIFFLTPPTPLLFNWEECGRV